MKKKLEIGKEYKSIYGENIGQLTGFNSKFIEGVRTPVFRQGETMTCIWGFFMLYNI